MHVYLEATLNKNVKETWQSEKWLLDAPDEVLTPMFRRERDQKVFYVNELVSCDDHRWFIPERFFLFEGDMWASGKDAVLTSVSMKFEDEML